MLKLAAVSAVRRADGEAAGRQRRRAGRGELDGVGGAIRQIEGEAERIARVGLAGGKIDRERRRRAGRSGHVAFVTVDVVETELSFNPNGEPGDVFGDRRQCRRGRGSRRRRRRGDDKPAQAVGALIGLQPFGDHLLQPGLGGRAVEDVVGGCQRRRVDGGAREDIAVADLGVEDADDRGQFGGGVLLADGLPGRRQVLRRGRRVALHLVGDIRQRLQPVLAAEIMVLTLVIVVPKAEMLASCDARRDRKALVDSHAGIVRST